MDDIKFFLHEHYLLFDKYNNQEASCCDKCNQQIDDEWAFTCEPCNFWLHKSCALQYLPPQISHPQHLFKLVRSEDFFNRITIMCDNCFSLTRGCVYECQNFSGNFNLDLTCASSTSSYDIESKIRSSNDHKYKKINHFCNSQSLTLLKYRKVGKDSSSCSWCEKNLLPGMLIYGCLDLVIFFCYKSEVFLHESCLINMPTLIPKHHFHPSHPIHLQPIYHMSGVKCNGCGGVISAKQEFYAYSCKKCKFYLHICCVNFQPTIKHELHEHPLTYFRKEGYNATLRCKSCYEKIRDKKIGKFVVFYRCVQCDFNLHFDCSSIPFGIKHEYHIHELVLIDSFIEDDDSEEYYCDICEKERKPKHHVYYCKSCKYVAHIGCALGKSIDTKRGSTTNLVDSSVMEQEETKLRNENFTIDHLDQINHFDHEHPLSFNEIIEIEKDEIDLVCQACRLEILGGAYGCKSCKYYLHKKCTQLSNEVLHPLHLQHTLKLITDSPMQPAIPCYKCRSCSKGFAYLCPACGFRLDLKCISTTGTEGQRVLENTESHELQESKLCPFNQGHKLDFIIYESRSPEKFKRFLKKTLSCTFCKLELVGPSYKCSDCGYKVHEHCLGFPSQIRVPQFHPQHSLHVGYGVGKEKLCPVCKHTNYASISYSCEQCGLHLHSYCSKSLNRAIKSKSHLHNLYYFESTAENFNIKQKCPECKSGFSNSDRFYFCMECDTSLHSKCVQIPLSIKSKYHIHPFTLINHFKEDDSREYYCDICEEERYPENQIYYCDECQGSIVAHISCVLTSVEKIVETESEVSRTDEFTEEQHEGKVSSAEEDKFESEASSTDESTEEEQTDDEDL